MNLQALVVQNSEVDNILQRYYTTREKVLLVHILLEKMLRVSGEGEQYFKSIS